MKNRSIATYPARDRQVQRVLLIEGGINFLVFIAKLLTGLATGSLAIVGDAMHSLTDIFNNAVAWMIIRLSATSPDREHPYGHRKFETLAVFFLASLLVILSFELALAAIRKDETAVLHSNWALAVMLFALVLNISLAIWERIWAKRLQSDILQADASHTLADVLTTVVVIAGWQLSAMGYVWLDRVCALAVAAFILFLAYHLLKKSLPILVDEYSLDPQLLSQSVMAIDGVKQVRRVRSRWIGAEKSVDLVILVNSDLSTKDSHHIATQVEAMIYSQFGVADISIRVEPYRHNSEIV